LINLQRKSYLFVSNLKLCILLVTAVTPVA